MINQMNQEQLLHFIDVVSFQVNDSQLFLDTHPECEEARKHFNHYLKLRKEAMKEYAMKYGPLTIDSMQDTEGWAWGEQPWPWEGGGC